LENGIDDIAVPLPWSYRAGEMAAGCMFASKWHASAIHAKRTTMSSALVTTLGGPATEAFNPKTPQIDSFFVSPWQMHRNKFKPPLRQ